MAIGIVSSDDFNSELERGEKSPLPKLRPAQVLDINRGGRSEGDNNVPDSLRKVIGEEAVVNGRQSALAFAKMFGVSDSSVSAYTDGKTSTSSPTRNQKLSEHLRTSKLNIARKASKKLNAALLNITEEKLADCKATDLALVAKSMSGIIKDMEPSEPHKNEATFNGPSIVLYNPGFSKENRFESIETNE